MRDYGKETYGEFNAAVFDRMVERVGMPPPTVAVEVLRRLAGGGSVLELGVGTGRVALPLAEAGVEVRGIEASPSMIEELRRKDETERVRVIQGDFADVDPGDDATFPLIYAVGHTFFSLATQEEQVRCFQNVAKRLRSDGVFVVEVWVPDPAQIAAGILIAPVVVEPDAVVIALKYYDRESQLLVGHHIELNRSGVHLYPEVVRYAPPSELDLMAQIAGLRLRSRHAGWSQEPFTGSSTTHVTLYERAQ